MASNTFAGSSLNANFRQYGGLNNLLRQKFSRTYSATSHLQHPTDSLGEPDSKINVQSHLDLQGNSVIRISELQFSDNSIQTTAYTGTSSGTTSAPAPTTETLNTLTVLGNLYVDGSAAQLTASVNASAANGLVVGAPPNAAQLTPLGAISGTSLGIGSDITTGNPTTAINATGNIVTSSLVLNANGALSGTPTPVLTLGSGATRITVLDAMGDISGNALSIINNTVLGGSLAVNTSNTLSGTTPVITVSAGKASIDAAGDISGSTLALNTSNTISTGTTPVFTVSGGKASIDAAGDISGNTLRLNTNNLVSGLGTVISVGPPATTSLPAAFSVDASGDLVATSATLYPAPGAPQGTATKLLSIKASGTSSALPVASIDGTGTVRAAAVTATNALSGANLTLNPNNSFATPGTTVFSVTGPTTTTGTTGSGINARIDTSGNMFCANLNSSANVSVDGSMNVQGLATFAGRIPRCLASYDNTYTTTSSNYYANYIPTMGWVNSFLNSQAANVTPAFNVTTQNITLTANAGSLIALPASSYPSGAANMYVISLAYDNNSAACYDSWFVYTTGPATTTGAPVNTVIYPNTNTVTCGSNTAYLGWNAAINTAVGLYAAASSANLYLAPNVSYSGNANVYISQFRMQYSNPLKAFLPPSLPPGAYPAYTGLPYMSSAGGAPSFDLSNNLYACVGTTVLKLALPRSTVVWTSTTAPTTATATVYTGSSNTSQNLVNLAATSGSYVSTLYNALPPSPNDFLLASIASSSSSSDSLVTYALHATAPTPPPTFAAPSASVNVTPPNSQYGMASNGCFDLNGYYYFFVSAPTTANPPTATVYLTRPTATALPGTTTAFASNASIAPLSSATYGAGGLAWNNGFLYLYGAVNSTGGAIMQLSANLYVAPQPVLTVTNSALVGSLPAGGGGATSNFVTLIAFDNVNNNLYVLLNNQTIYMYSLAPCSNAVSSSYGAMTAVALPAVNPNSSAPSNFFDADLSNTIYMLGINPTMTSTNANYNLYFAVYFSTTAGSSAQPSNTVGGNTGTLFMNPLSSTPNAPSALTAASALTLASNGWYPYLSPTTIASTATPGVPVPVLTGIPNTSLVTGTNNAACNNAISSGCSFDANGNVYANFTTFAFVMAPLPLATFCPAPSTYSPASNTVTFYNQSYNISNPPYPLGTYTLTLDPFNGWLYQQFPNGIGATFTFGYYGLANPPASSPGPSATSYLIGSSTQDTASNGAVSTLSCCDALGNLYSLDNTNQFYSWGVGGGGVLMGSLVPAVPIANTPGYGIGGLVYNQGYFYYFGAATSARTVVQFSATMGASALSSTLTVRTSTFVPPPPTGTGTTGTTTGTPAFINNIAFDNLNNQLYVLVNNQAVFRYSLGSAAPYTGVPAASSTPTTVYNAGQANTVYTLGVSLNLSARTNWLFYSVYTYANLPSFATGATGTLLQTSIPPTTWPPATTGSSALFGTHPSNFPYAVQIVALATDSKMPTPNVFLVAQNQPYVYASNAASGVYYNFLVQNWTIHALWFSPQTQMLYAMGMNYGTPGLMLLSWTISYYAGTTTVSQMVDNLIFSYSLPLTNPNVSLAVSSGSTPTYYYTFGGKVYGGTSQPGTSTNPALAVQASTVGADSRGNFYYVPVGSSTGTSSDTTSSNTNTNTNNIVAVTRTSQPSYNQVTTEFAFLSPPPGLGTPILGFAFDTSNNIYVVTATSLIYYTCNTTTVPPVATNPVVLVNQSSSGTGSTLTLTGDVAVDVSFNVYYVVNYNVSGALVSNAVAVFSPPAGSALPPTYSSLASASTLSVNAYTSGTTNILTPGAGTNYAYGWGWGSVNYFGVAPTMQMDPYGNLFINAWGALNVLQVPTSTMTMSLPPRSSPYTVITTGGFAWFNVFNSFSPLTECMIMNCFDGNGKFWQYYFNGGWQGPFESNSLISSAVFPAFAVDEGDAMFYYVSQVTTDTYAINGYSFSATSWTPAFTTLSVVIPGLQPSSGGGLIIVYNTNAGFNANFYLYNGLNVQYVSVGSGYTISAQTVTFGGGGFPASAVVINSMLPDGNGNLYMLCNGQYLYAAQNQGGNPTTFGAPLLLYNAGVSGSMGGLCVTGSSVWYCVSYDSWGNVVNGSTATHLPYTVIFQGGLAF